MAYPSWQAARSGPTTGRARPTHAMADHAMATVLWAWNGRLQVPLLLVLVGALIGAAGAALTSRGGGPAPPGAPAPADAAAPAGPTAAAGHPGASAHAPRQRLEPEGTLLLVRVHERDSGRRLPGARVCFLEGADLETVRAGTDGEFPEQLIERHGRVLLADAEGLLRVEVRQSVLLTGRSGALFGTATLRPDPAGLPADAAGEHRLLLDRDVTLRIRAVDAAGHPAAHAPLEVLPAGEALRSRPQALGLTTDAGGIAAIAHWQVRLRQRLWTGAHVGRLLVRPALPGHDGEGVPLDPERPPPEVLVRMPATGSVAVRTPEGLVPAEGHSLTLQVVPAGTGDPVPEVLGTREWTAPLARGGPAAFGRVALGQRFRAQYRRGSLKAVAVFAGPVRAGQEVAFDLRAVPESTVLTGRALDPGRVPLRDASLRFVYATAAGAAARWIPTDREGRFCINLGPADAHQALLDAALAVAPQGAAPGLVRRLVPARLAPGELDLGDLVFDPAALLAAGRIGIDGAAAAATDLVPGLVPALVVEFRQGDGDEARWEHDALAAVAAPAPGRFEVRGRARSDRYRLRPTGPGHLPCAPLEFAPGAADLAIDLQTGLQLDVVLRVDPGIGAEDLAVRLRPPPGGAAGDPLPGRIAQAGDGALHARWDACWPGVHALEVRATASGVGLLDVPVHVAPSPQPGAVEVDLRRRLRVLGLRVLGSDGRVVPDGQESRIVWTDGAEDGRAHPVPLRSGMARIVTGRPFLDVLVLARDHLPQRHRATPGEQTVVLAALPAVVVRVRGPSLPHGSALGVQLIGPCGGEATAGPGARTAPRATTPLAVADPAGAARPSVTTDGTHRVAVLVGRADHWIRVAGVEPEVIDVPARPGTHTFEVRVPPAALREALSALSTR